MPSSNPNSAPAKASDVVAVAARAFERDRYLTALLAPDGARVDLIALAAFAGEIGRIPGFVSEPMLGEIRLQWWRDTLARYGAGVGQGIVGHPIADAVGAAMWRHAVSAEMLTGMIDAHAVRLDDAPFADSAALVANVVAIEGAQFALAARVLGADPARAAGLIEDAGLAHGLARLLIELPATLAEGRWLLPADRAAAHGVSAEQVRRGDALGGLGRVTAELAATARAADARVRVGWRRTDPAVRAALLPVALVRPYLEACERRGGPMSAVPVGGDVARDVVARDIAPLTRLWRLWVAHLTGRL